MSTVALAKLIRDKAVLFGDFTLRSGKKSKYYIDKYLFETDPQILQLIAENITQLLPKGTTMLAGVELGAVPLATAVSLKADLPFIIVRKEVKDYGTAKIYEGKVNPDDQVVMIEDVITTGGAALKAAVNLRNAGIKITKIIGVIDREEGGVANLQAAGFAVEAMFNKSALGLNS